MPALAQFTNTSTGNLTTSEWDFGDGAVSSVVGPVHAYVQYGTYRVKLIQGFAGGVKDTFLLTLSIDPLGPSGVSSRMSSINLAAFTVSIPKVYTVGFTNTSQNANKYQWQFGDGSNSSSDSSLIKHTYSGIGPFRVKLTATGDGGVDTCNATISFR